MDFSKLGRRLINSPVAIVSALALICSATATADSFSSTIFATGAAVGGSNPDSVTIGGNSVWVEYGNGADSTGASGSSTIVQYTMTGAVQHTYTIQGSVDGLKYDPNSGQVWALVNQDANASLKIINPGNGQVTSYTYGAPYSTSGASTSRGFDDVAFLGSKVFMSETNPAGPTDPVVVQVTTPLNSPVTQTPVLELGNLLATDADSLKSTPSGGLILSGEADNALTFMTNPGLATQTATSLPLVSATGAPAGSPDDVIFPTATNGTFFVADTGANTVYEIQVSGLSTDSLYGDVNGSFGNVNTSTGLFTEDVAGVNFHGLDFVAAAPEPSSLGLGIAGCLFLAFRLRRSSTQG